MEKISSTASMVTDRPPVEPYNWAEAKSVNLAKVFEKICSPAGEPLVKRCVLESWKQRLEGYMLDADRDKAIEAARRIDFIQALIDKANPDEEEESDTSEPQLSGWAAEVYHFLDERSARNEVRH